MIYIVFSKQIELFKFLWYLRNCNMEWIYFSTIMNNILICLNILLEPILFLYHFFCLIVPFFVLIIFNWFKNRVLDLLVLVEFTNHNEINFIVSIGLNALTLIFSFLFFLWSKLFHYFLSFYEEIRYWHSTLTKTQFELIFGFFIFIVFSWFSFDVEFFDITKSDDTVLVTKLFFIFFILMMI